jgi:hypothetical protein
LNVGSASGPLTREAHLGVDLHCFATISLLLSTRHTPVGWLHTLHYGSQSQTYGPCTWKKEAAPHHWKDLLEFICDAISPWALYYQSYHISSLYVWRVNGCQNSASPQLFEPISIHVEVATQIRSTTQQRVLHSFHAFQYFLLLAGGAHKMEPSARHPALLIG